MAFRYSGAIVQCANISYGAQHCRFWECKLGEQSESSGSGKKRSWSTNRKYNVFGPEFYDGFLEVLSTTGLYIRACEAVGCWPPHVADYRKENSEFQLLCDLALEDYRAVFIEAAKTRAVDGYEVPIIGGRERNEIVAQERRYSDRLMELFLKRSPDGSFTEKQEVTVNGGMDIKQELNLRSLSKRARSKMRELLEIIQEDEANEALGIPVEK